MVTYSWLYDAILYIYALSLFFYFSGFARPTLRASRIGEGLLAFVWLLQTVYLAANLYTNRLMSGFTMFGTLFLFSWLLVTVSLIVGRFLRIGILVFWINLFGFAILALHVFSNPKVQPLRPDWNISDELLFIHISLAIASYAALLLSAVFSGLYLFLHRRLKEKHWTTSLKRLPSLEKLDGYAYRSVMAGLPMLLMALALGIVWLILLNRSGYLLDPKVLNSLFILVAYSFYLVKRLSARVPGNRLALWNLAAFGVVLINFILSNWFSQFHQWVWM